MPVLPDLLIPNLRVVICGTAAGHVSAAREAYYAGPGNQFWPVLHRIGLTPRQLRPEEYRELQRYGIGLTDLVKGHHGMDKSLPASGFDPETLRRWLLENKPRALAFNGKKAVQVFYGRDVDYGHQPDLAGDTALFVLPSTSGAARGFWDEGPWREMAEYARHKP